MAYKKIKAAKLVKNALTALEVHTNYRNCFPYNCLYKDKYGTIWGDCVNAFPKGVIWAHACNKKPFKKRKKYTYFYNGSNNSYPGIEKSGLGDWDISYIMSRCKKISFSDLVPGALMAIGGAHIALFCGKYKRDGKTYNSIEWNDFGDVSGAIPFWTDSAGRRFWFKGGGYMGGNFTDAGLLTEWIDYGKDEKICKFEYAVYTEDSESWLPEVINDNDYAGIPGDAIIAVKVKCNEGNVRYSVHTWKGNAQIKYKKSGWMPEIKNGKYHAGDSDLQQPIDGFILFSDVPAAYRVGLKLGPWLPWVKTEKANYKDPDKGFAGIIGRVIDRIEIKPL